MTAPTFPALATSLVLCSSILGCAAGATSAASRPPSTAVRPPESGHVFRLDFVVTTTEPQKPPVAQSFTLNLEEDHGGDVHVGSNVPLGTSNARIDLGLKLHCRYAMVGDGLLLHDDTELSEADGGAIHKLSMHGDAVLAPGAPVVVASAEEPIGHRRYQVSVTATKVR